MSKINMRRSRLLVIVVIALLFLCLATPTVRAFEGRGGDVVVIKEDEVIGDDLYVAADEFILDGTVKGDLVVVGRTIQINGIVEGDLTAAGQSVIVDGAVKDDVRIAGWALSVGGQIADDLLAGGFSLVNENESSVEGDLLFGGYQTRLNGNVTGNARLSGNAVEIAGAIGGDTNVDVGDADPGEQMPPGFPFAPNLPPVPSIPAGLTIDERASLGGDLDYTANAKTNIPAGAVAGETSFKQYIPDIEEKPEPERPSPIARVFRWFVRQVRRLFTLLLVGASMMWLVPDWTRKITNIVETKPLPSLGWGVVTIAAYGMAMLVLLIATGLLALVFGVVTLGGLAGRFAVLGGIVMSTLTFSFSITWAYITRIVISLLLGQLIFRLFKSTAAEHRWWPMLLGVFCFSVIAAIPVLGWLVRLAAVLLGLGAIWLWASDWLKARRASQVGRESQSI